MSTEANKQPPVKVTKSADYKTVYATGIFGGINPLEGRIIFYLDRPMPKIKDAPYGNMETSEIERELQVEVHMPTGLFLQMFEWMKNHVDRLEKAGALVKVKQEGIQ
ncbi:MAG: hypothetical protein ABSF09_13610 [Candidatus Bathyarchaeia archaeon]|jgi:hypothetical protein